MRKTILEPAFRITLAELYQLGDKGVQLINQDQAVLAGYGVDAAYKAFLETKTQQLKDFPTDPEFEGGAKNRTEIKDHLADNLKVGIRSLMIRVKQIYRDDSSKFIRFGTQGLDKMNDLELAKCGYRVVQMATEFMPDLAPKGITQTTIDALQADTKSFDEAIDAQQYHIRLRNAATSDRLKLANEVYAKISELFDYGKDYWQSRNAARYKDYLIYDTPAAKKVEGDGV